MAGMESVSRDRHSWSQARSTYPDFTISNKQSPDPEKRDAPHIMTHTSKLVVGLDVSQMNSADLGSLPALGVFEGKGWGKRSQPRATVRQAKPGVGYCGRTGVWHSTWKAPQR